MLGVLAIMVSMNGNHMIFLVVRSGRPIFGRHLRLNLRSKDA